MGKRKRPPVATIVKVYRKKKAPVKERSISLELELPMEHDVLPPVIRQPKPAESQRGVVVCSIFGDEKI